jgi:Protein of unknown function (DUF429)
VQDLEGTGSPFQRLADVLASKQFSAAAIDAPFSLPSRYVPVGARQELLEMVDALSLDTDAPFPNGPPLITLAETVAILDPLRPLDPLKPLRRTERWWADGGTNVRSTLWWTPRGGAPFAAAACMKLLAPAGSPPPCWPWSSKTEGLVAEAFPAAQLRSWGLPFKKYDGSKGSDVRQQIVRGLEPRVNFDRFRKPAEESADALDAVISSFAALAAYRGNVIRPDADDTTVSREGWIAVHA